jgi:hypothetical protein
MLKRGEGRSIRPCHLRLQPHVQRLPALGSDRDGFGAQAQQMHVLARERYDTTPKHRRQLIDCRHDGCQIVAKMDVFPPPREN